MDLINVSAYIVLLTVMLCVINCVELEVFICYEVSFNLV